MKAVRWALLGTSGTADAVFAPVLSGLAGTELVGAVGSTPAGSAGFKERHAAERSFANLDDLAEDPSVDAVWIATPNDLHAPQAIQLLEAGKHVLVEKPMAISTLDAQKVVQAARRSGCVLRVGYHQRFRRAHQDLRDAMSDGLLGTVGLARLHAYFAYPQDPPAWRRSVERSGGWAINDIGTHLVDLALWALGPVTLESCWLGTTRFGVATDDTTVLVLSLEGGGRVVIDTSTALASPGSRIEVYGSAGYFRAEGSFDGPTAVETSWGGKSELPAEDALAAEVTDFNQVVRGNASASVGEDGVLATDNVRLIEQARAFPFSLVLVGSA